MTVGSNAVKSTAKTVLKGNWLKAIVCIGVVIFSYFINSFVSSLVSVFAGDIIAEIFYVILSLFILLPLFMGALRYFWRMILESNDKPIIVFYYFSSKNLYLKTLKLIFAVILKLIPIAIVVFLPAVLVWLLSQSYFFEWFNLAIPLWSRNLEYAIIFTKTLSTVVLIFYALRFYILPVLFVACEDLEILEALNMSSIISKKSTLDFIYLFFSFFGWILISLLAIPLIFTLPYMITSYLVHTRFAITEYNNHIESSMAEEYPSFTVGA